MSPCKDCNNIMCKVRGESTCDLWKVWFSKAWKEVQLMFKNINES